MNSSRAINLTATTSAALASLLGGCASNDAAAPQITLSESSTSQAALATYSDWPAITSAIPKDPAMEAQIAQIVAGMTLAQKVGQMTQAEIQNITPAEVTQYYIGSVLNGGGSWPGNNKHAAVTDWLALADAYYNASMATDMAVKIPIIWGTDAVHGDNNVYGATLFPHNIGLGAARDPDLVRRIGEATARAVRATGLDWDFSPCLAVARDDRWGRSYESYSEDPAIVNQYAGQFVTGLQGSFASDANVVATAKHFIGDGGTDKGDDQGINSASTDELINIHGQGYYSALAAGAQTVMVSYSSWTNAGLGINYGKLHGAKYMLTDVLKTKIGFDGLLVSDWNGIGQVTGCSDSSCPQAVNAGIDLFMVPTAWKTFISNTMQQVQSGQIPMARIDDAVTRILRVKLRAGLFQGKRPSQRLDAGNAAALQARALGREAVSKSLVLLKNQNNVLPITRGKKVLVVGKSADSMVNQTGGWSLTWQGTGNNNTDFPNGDTVLAGIREATGAANVTFSQNGRGVKITSFDVVIAVVGETPYAEGNGDIGPTSTLLHTSRYREDLSLLDTVGGKGVPVVTVFLSGRPLYVNDLLNRSDAFVAAWLPGTEGKGVSDVLFRDSAGNVNLDFTGKLSFSWPGSACQTPLNTGDASYAPLFPYGYGLSYSSAVDVPPLSEATTSGGCG